MNFLKVKKLKLKTIRGFGIIEIVIAVFVITTALFSIMLVSKLSLEINRHNLYSTQAGFLLEEGSEGLRMMRDSSWSKITALATSTPYYIIFSKNSWSATTTATTTDGVFYRTVKTAGVYRDSNDDIAGSGTYDIGTKKLSLSVSWWNGTATSSQAMDMYLTDLFGN